MIKTSVYRFFVSGLLSLFFIHFALHGIESKNIEVEMLVKGSESWDQTALPAYPTGTPEITILRITIPAHTALPMHHHPVINAGVLLEGELTVITPKGETKVLHAGDPLIELVDQLHYGKNEGNEPAVILVFYAGEKGRPITVKTVEAPVEEE